MLANTWVMTHYLLRPVPTQHMGDNIPLVLRQCMGDDLLRPAPAHGR